MKAYHDFRLFYNQTIHAELMHLEMQRRNIMRRIYFGLVLSALFILLGWQLDVFLLNLIFFIILGVYLNYLVTEIRLYFQSFKPRIATALLDFLDNGVNYSDLQYDALGSISKEQFLAGGLYECAADEYEAEDYISGKIREMPFELCELRVADISPVRSGMEPVFSGIFIVGDFLKPEMRGIVFILPDVYRKYHSQSARAADLAGAKRIENLLLPEFEAIFDTYASPNIKPAQFISDDFQRALIAFHRDTGRSISISVHNSKLYIAQYQNKDLLEPSLWSSNVSYAQIKEYQEDLNRVFSIIHAMDVMN
jgi:hypothetical protein